MCDQHAAGIDEGRGFSCDLHHFRHRADAHLRIELERAAEKDVEIAPLHLRETGELERDVVAAGNQIRSYGTDHWRWSQRP